MGRVSMLFLALNDHHDHFAIGVAGGGHFEHHRRVLVLGLIVLLLGISRWNQNPDLSRLKKKIQRNDVFVH
jgi:hypothetical protein